MMKHIAALLVTTALGSHAALAMLIPTPGKTDPNIKTVPYDPMQRVMLEGMVGRPTVVKYGPTEEIAGVQQSKEAPFDPTDPKQEKEMRNILTLWPHTAGAGGNMQVITNLPDGTHHIYQYQIDAKPSASYPDDSNPEITYGLIYTYPAVVHAAQVAARQAREAVQVKKTAEDRLSVDFYYGKANTNYVAHGDRADAFIAPKAVRDNGRLTGFQFPGNTHTPNIYEGRCVKDGERLVATTVWNDWLIADTTAPAFCLRLGKAVLEIDNKAYDPIGVNTGTGTVSPSVQRILLK